ncbi:MAG TPA: HIT family protein [Rhizomicrobium sp.]|jgi:diadenosine tetraphosphate (Ap4A) HIT family hydrolase|nr:HIT family protein [Rhizomicrobium sp.]
MSEFVLHPRLEADTLFVADWALSRVLAMNDARFPWVLLVPRRAGCVEIADLPASDRVMLIEEIARASEGLKRSTACAKLNIGALGNQVTQLHIHVVGRNAGDEAWPGAVWGYGRPRPYATRQAADFIAAFVNAC